MIQVLASDDGSNALAAQVDATSFAPGTLTISIGTTIQLHNMSGPINISNGADSVISFDETSLLAPTTIVSTPTGLALSTVVEIDVEPIGALGAGQE